MRIWHLSVSNRGVDNDEPISKRRALDDNQHQYRPMKSPQLANTGEWKIQLQKNKEIKLNDNQLRYIYISLNCAHVSSKETGYLS